MSTPTSLEARHCPGCACEMKVPLPLMEPDWAEADEPDGEDGADAAGGLVLLPLLCPD